MRRLFVAVLPLALPMLLGGCGLPPAISAVAYLIDGASIIGTGKTVGDHAISAAAGEDCALFRVVSGELICQGPDDTGKPSVIALAAANTVYPGEEPAEQVARAEAFAAAHTDPASSVQLAAIAPANGRAAPASMPERAEPNRWQPVLTVGAAAVPGRRGPGWPVVAAPAVPVAPAPVAAAAAPRRNDPAMLRAHARLLEFRAPIRMLAQHPGGDS